MFLAQCQYQSGKYFTYSHFNLFCIFIQYIAQNVFYWLYSHLPLPDGMSDKELTEKLYPSSAEKSVFKMPDYEYVHKELQKSGVNWSCFGLNTVCGQCRNTVELAYQSTQFNKYYNDFVMKNSVTMHLNHKPGEILQVDWAGDTASVIDTDTGEAIPAYVFVATLPYSGYAYSETSHQECGICGIGRLRGGYWIPCWQKSG